MTPREKAQELVDKYIDLQDEYLKETSYNFAKQCALIAVDEVLLIKKEIWDDFHSEYFDYWQQVKTEIENL